MPVFIPSILTAANIWLWNRSKMTAVKNGFVEKERMENTNHRPIWQWSPSGGNHQESSPEYLSLGPREALLWPLSFVVPVSALWTSLPFYFMTSSEVGTGAMPFLGGFTVIISQFLLAQVLELRDYFRDWRIFCRPSLWFLGSCYLIRNLGGFWSLWAQSVPCVGNSGQRSGLGTSFKYKSSWRLLSSVVTPFSFT